MKKFILCVFTLVLVTNAYGYLPKKKETKNWQRNVTRDVMTQPIEYGQALYWRLDNNGFAVKIPGYFIVFDYSNDIPTGQWEYGKLLEGKELNRSLLTGVFEPEEFEDLFPNDIAVVVYSHLHPAEKTLRAAFDWRKHFKKVLYIGPQEVYEVYRRVVSDKIESAKTNGLEAAEEQIIEEDALSMFRVAKPEIPISVGGLTIMPYKPHDPLAEQIGEVLEGLEYVVETDNGVSFYHSGALGCRVCIEESGILEAYEKPKIISANTQKLAYCQNRLVKINGKRVDVCPGEEKRIGFALYVPKDFDGIGAISVWADGLPDARFPMSGTGITGRNAKLYIMEKEFFDQAFKDPYGEYDIKALEILVERLKIERKYKEDLEDFDPRSVFHYENEETLLSALQGNLTYEQTRGRLDVRDQLHEIQSDLVMKSFRKGTLPPKLDWFPLTSIDVPRGYCHHFNKIIYYTGYAYGSYPSFWNSSSKVVAAYIDEEERRKLEKLRNGEEDESALEEPDASETQEQEDRGDQADDEEQRAKMSRLQEYRLKREAEKVKTEEMKQRRDLEEEQKSLKFGKVSMLIDPHFLRYTGEITNKGKWNKNFVTVKMSFFDKKGQFDHYEQALTHPLHIKYGETASFTIYTNKMDPPPKYELSVTWDLDEESENRSGGF